MTPASAEASTYDPAGNAPAPTYVTTDSLTVAAPCGVVVKEPRASTDHWRYY
jgi:hypothetical protein